MANRSKIALLAGIAGVLFGAVRLYQDLRKDEPWTALRALALGSASLLLLVRVLDLLQPRKKSGWRRAASVAATAGMFLSRRASKA